MRVPVVRRDSPLTAMRSLFDDFFSEPFNATSIRTRKETWPRVDITEDKDHYTVRADLPGMKKDDITVTVEHDMLKISGEKMKESKKEENGYCHFERSYGSFSRSFTLPQYVDKQNIDANYKNGVLELQLKKSADMKKKTRFIEVKG